MNKKLFFFILAALCVTAAIVLVVIGAKRTAQPPVKEGLVSLGAVRLTYDEERTREEYVEREAAIKNGKTDPEDPDANDLYTVIYSYVHPQYGLIEYSFAVDTKREYDDLTTDRKPFVYEGDVFKEPDGSEEAFRDNSKTTYVYAWPKTEAEAKADADSGNSLYNFKFSDSIRDLYDISEEIDPHEKVSSTYYFIVSGILLLGAAYLVFLAMTTDQPGRRRAETSQQSQYTARQNAQQRPSAAAQNAQPRRPSAGQQGEWTCTKCGAKNAFGQPRCRLCGTQRPSGERK